MHYYIVSIHGRDAIVALYFVLSSKYRVNAIQLACFKRIFWTSAKLSERTIETGPVSQSKFSQSVRTLFKSK